MVQTVSVMDYDVFSEDLECSTHLIKEPHRLWKSYMVYPPLFFIYMLEFNFQIQMKNIYLYPLTARTKNAVINPYIGNLRDALGKNYNVLNAHKPSTTGIFDILRYIRKVDVVYFNWSEELPSLHRGRAQGIFLLVLLQYLKLSGVMIVSTLHNKKSHFDKHSKLKKRLYGQMLKKSDLIITHARGIRYYS